MKLTLSLILNLILVVFIILLFTGFIDTRNPVKPTDQILGYMQQNKSMAALVIAEDGAITPIKADGAPMAKCGLGSNPKLPPCEGFGGTKGVVQSSQMYNVFRVKGSICATIIGGDGIAYQICG